MTKEEREKSIDALKISVPIHALTEEKFNNYIQTLNKIMDWLEQEPCEDVISREEAIDACNQSVNILEATDRIKDLPPVTPQEPFMNKPCIAHQVCHEDKVNVLDKIRAEIDEQYDKVHPYNLSCAEGLEMALGIIDKYKSESEDKKNECI